MISSKCFGYLTLFMAGLSDSLSYFAPRPVDWNVITKATETEFLASCKSYFLSFLLKKYRCWFSLDSLWFLFYLLKKYFYLFCVVQALPAPGRSGVHIRSSRFESWSGNSSSTFTSTRRNGCSSPECSTSPTARSKFGSRTGEWKRRSWAEIACSTSPETPSCERGFPAWAVTLRPISYLAEL